MPASKPGLALALVTWPQTGTAANNRQTPSVWCGYRVAVPPTCTPEDPVPIEFLGIAATNDGSETTPAPGRASTATTPSGWAGRTRTSAGTGCCSPTARRRPSPRPRRPGCSPHTERLQVLLAHRPNVSYPTFAAKTFATLDQIGDGRLTVHFITGGTDHEQQREGDYLTKDQRYSRTREYMQIVKKAWTSHEPFDWDGEHYRFADFVSDTFPVQQPRPDVSFGGSSDAAYAAGGAEADIFALWGEPLAETAAQIERVHAAARAAGRTTMPRIQVAFRPIIAPTEELAWEKAYRTVDRITRAHGRRAAADLPPAPADRAGEHRLAAAAGDRRARGAVRPCALDADGQGHRRRGQLQRPGRDAGDGRRRPAGLRRPRRGHHLDARLRPARRRHRRRPVRDPAGPRGGRQAGRRPRHGVRVSTIAVVGNPKPRSRTRSAAELVVERLTGAPPDRVVDVDRPRRRPARLG